MRTSARSDARAGQAVIAGGQPQIQSGMERSSRRHAFARVINENSKVPDKARHRQTKEGMTVEKEWATYPVSLVLVDFLRHDTSRSASFSEGVTVGGKAGPESRRWQRPGRQNETATGPQRRKIGGTYFRWEGHVAVERRGRTAMYSRLYALDIPRLAGTAPVASTRRSAAMRATRSAESVDHRSVKDQCGREEGQPA